MKKLLSILLAIIMIAGMVSILGSVASAAGLTVRLEYHPTYNNRLNFELPSDSPLYIPVGAAPRYTPQCSWRVNGEGSLWVNGGYSAKKGEFYVLELKLMEKDSDNRKGFDSVYFNGVKLTRRTTNVMNNLGYNEFASYDDESVLILKVVFYNVSTEINNPYDGNSADTFGYGPYNTGWYVPGETTKVGTGYEQGCHSSFWTSIPSGIVFTKSTFNNYTFTMPSNNVTCVVNMAEDEIEGTFTMPKEGDAVGKPDFKLTSVNADLSAYDEPVWVDVTGGTRPNATGKFTAGRKYLALIYVEGAEYTEIDGDTVAIVDGKEYDIFTLKRDGRTIKFFEIPYNPTEHNYGPGVVTKEATCGQDGEMLYTCPCGHSSKTSVIPATGEHTWEIKDYEEDLYGATIGDDGRITYTCSVCGQTKDEVIPAVKEIKLSKTTFTYNGKSQKPTVTVYDRNGNQVTDFYTTVTNGSTKNPGTYTLKIMAGDYEDMRSNTHYYFEEYRTITIKPTQVKSLKAATVKSTSIKLSWAKVTGAKSYEIYYRAGSKGSFKKLGTSTTNSFTAKKLTANKAYQFKVRAVAGSAKGSFSSVLKTGTAPKAPVVTLKSTKSKTVTVSWKKVTGAKKYVVYKSTNGKSFTKVATVTKLTYNITKLTGGKKIYVKVYAVNSYGKTASAIENIKVKK